MLIFGGFMLPRLLILKLSIVSAALSCSAPNDEYTISSVTTHHEGARETFNSSWYRLKYVGGSTASFTSEEHLFVGALWDYDYNFLEPERVSFALYTDYKDDQQNSKQNSQRILAPVGFRLKEIRSSALNSIDQCTIDIDVEFIHQNIIIGMLRWEGFYRPEEGNQCYAPEDTWLAFKSAHIGSTVSTHKFINSNPEKYGICTGPYDNSCDIKKNEVVRESEAESAVFFYELDIMFLPEAEIVTPDVAEKPEEGAPQ